MARQITHIVIGKCPDYELHIIVLDILCFMFETSADCYSPIAECVIGRCMIWDETNFDMSLKNILSMGYFLVHFLDPVNYIIINSNYTGSHNEFDNFISKLRRYNSNKKYFLSNIFGQYVLWDILKNLLSIRM